MKNNYRNYTDKQIIEAVKNNKSLAQVLKELGLKPSGGNYANMKRNLQRLNVNTDHWHGQAWNKGERLKDWSDYTRAYRLKPHLIKERSNKCEVCNRTEWFDSPITLEIHHIDGDRTNNVKSNLKLICPNCHSYTTTWRKRSDGRNEDVKTKKCSDCDNLISDRAIRCKSCAQKNKKYLHKAKDHPPKKCSDCDNLISNRATRCKSCAQKYKQNRKVKNRPSIEILLQEVAEIGYSATGRKYGVSDNAVRKWLK
jgi:hypothetical protein